MAQLFLREEDLSGPHQDVEREEILNKIESGVAVSIDDETAIVMCTEGRVIIDVSIDDRLVYFTWLPRDRAIKQRFWMNASSVEDLVTKAMGLPKIDFGVAMARGGA